MLDDVLNAIKLAGSATPAFKALFDAVKTLFGTVDQQVLQDAYEAEMAKSDSLHGKIQDL